MQAQCNAYCIGCFKADKDNNNDAENFWLNDRWQLLEG